MQWYVCGEYVKLWICMLGMQETLSETVTTHNHSIQLKSPQDVLTLKQLYDVLINLKDSKYLADSGRYG